jgi:hypothetical protein
MPMSFLRFARIIGLSSATVVLAGCSLERFGSGDNEPSLATPGGPVAAAPGAAERTARPTAPPVNMEGRWLLVAAGGGRCGMNFGASPGVGEGTIAPEGGCPGNFFTSRKWTFEQGGLIIRDHTGQSLALLALAGSSRFEGQASNGQAVSLAR